MSEGRSIPRIIGLTALMVAMVSACVWLGFWQLGVSQDEGRKAAVEAAAALPEAPLTEVTRPHSDFTGEMSNRRVLVTGTYDPERSFIVPGRVLDGTSGSWVVSPLVTDEGTVVVLRGFVAGTPDPPPAPPAGPVTVRGTLGPSESPRPDAGLPQRQRAAIELSELVNEWPGDLYNLVLLASAETGVNGATVDTDLTPLPPPELDSGLGLRNLAYAIQWWIFALFFIWMWWKMIETEQPEENAEAAPRESANA